MELLKFIFLIIIAIEAPFIKGASLRLEKTDFVKKSLRSYDSSLQKCEINRNDKLVKVDGKKELLNYFKILCPEKKLSAVILKDIVRSHRVVNIYILEKNEIKYLDIIQWDEPKRFKPSKDWISKLFNRDVEKMYLDGISGATLTKSSFKNQIEKIKVLVNEKN